MKNLILIIPVLLALAGAYLVMNAVGAEEIVQLPTGHSLPKGLTGMLGAVAIFGAIAISVEVVGKKKGPSEAGNT